MLSQHLTTNLDLISPIMSSAQYLVTPEGSKVVVGLEVCKLVHILLRTGGGDAIDRCLDYSCGKLDEGWEFPIPTTKILKGLQLEIEATLISGLIYISKSFLRSCWPSWNKEQ
jgi:hypothetical protein